MSTGTVADLYGDEGPERPRVAAREPITIDARVNGDGDSRNAVEVAHRQLAPISAETSQLFQTIILASRDENVDVDKLERLNSLYERTVDREAKRAYKIAFNQMQLELPVIDQRGAILNKAGEVQSNYAEWPDIHEAITPVLHRYGFGLGHRNVTTQAGQVKVITTLSHDAGHAEESEFLLPVDTSGNKNPVQAYGSSLSYAKRYNTIALANISSRARQDRDRDGADRRAPKIPDAPKQAEQQAEPAYNPPYAADGTMLPHALPRRPAGEKRFYTADEFAKMAAKAIEQAKSTEQIDEWPKLNKAAFDLLASKFPTAWKLVENALFDKRAALSKSSGDVVSQDGAAPGGAAQVASNASGAAPQVSSAKGELLGSILKIDTVEAGKAWGRANAEIMFTLADADYEEVSRAFSERIAELKEAGALK